MLASKKVDAQLNEEFSGPTYGAKQRQMGRGRKVNFGYHHAAANQLQALTEKGGGSGSADSDSHVDGSSVDKKNAKTKDKKPVVAVPPSAAANRSRTVKTPGKMTNNPQNSLNKYRIQIRKFIQSIEEYRKLEDSLKNTHETLVNMRQEILDSSDLVPGDIPDVQSSIPEAIMKMVSESKGDDQSRLTDVELECGRIREAYDATEEEKRKLEEMLDMTNAKLKCKEEELTKIKEMEKGREFHPPVSGEGDIEEVEMLKKTINKLDQENSDLMDKLKKYDDDKSEITRDDQKIKSLEKLIETLHVDVKNLKDQLKVEKESRNKLESENEKLKQDIHDLKSVSTSSDSKYIILEKDNKIQDLQNRLNEISRIRPHQTSMNQEVFKVDFSADTPSLVNQLAKFVQLYEELSREGFDLETKLKDAHMEIYRLEQILEKQLIKIKDQDDCLKNMEHSLSKVVIETRKSSRVDQAGGNQLLKCKCDEFQHLIKEKEDFSEKLKEKMTLLYQKYKQYKSECNLMRKKLDAFEKRNWLKKLVNL